MGFIRKYSYEIYSALILIPLFFATRLYNILSLPIFTDEAIYLRWAQIAKADATWRFISLTDGKQPSLVWLTAISMKFIHDPILAGRLVSVGAGFLTALSMYLIGRELFRDRLVGIFASIMYVVFPMALVYDRMALYESLVATFAMWSLYFEILLIRRVRLDLAFILGFVMGGGVLTKSSAFFNAYLLPASLLLFDWRQKKREKTLFKWAVFAITSTVITYAMYSILRLSPYFHIIAEKTTIFVYPLNQWIQHPFTYFYGNIHALLDWSLTYFTWPFFILAVSSFIISSKFFKEKVLLVLWFAAPFFALALFGNQLYPRFLFFMIVPLLFLVSFSLVKMSAIFPNIYIKAAIFVFVTALALRADYFIIFNFARAPIPAPDLNQYNNDWPSGGGVREAIQFFKKEGAKGKIFVGTQGTFGLMPYSLELYLVDNPNIKLKGFWPVHDTLPDDVIRASRAMPTYVVFYQPCEACPGKGRAPKNWPIAPVLRFQKPNPDATLTVYRVIAK